MLTTLVINCQGTNYFGFLHDSSIEVTRNGMVRISETHFSGKRLKLAMEAMGFESQDDLAIALGISQTAVWKLLNGVTQHPRGLYKISEVVNADPRWLMKEIGTDDQIEPNHKNLIKMGLQSNLISASIGRVTVRGHVQAGYWQNAQEWEESQHYQIFASHPDYKPEDLYALEVRGDSMNERYYEGDVLICTSLFKYQKELVNGKKVIVEREYKGEYEATVKEIEFGLDGEIKLWPRSTNKDHKSAIIIKKIQGDNVVNDITIRITGVVLSYYRNED